MYVVPMVHEWHHRIDADADVGRIVVAPRGPPRAEQTVLLVPSRPLAHSGLGLVEVASDDDGVAVLERLVCRGGALAVAVEQRLDEGGDALGAEQRIET